MHAPVPAREQTLTLKLDDIRCTTCADAVEEALRTQPGVLAVHLDWTADEVHVRYDAARTDSAELEHVVAATGCTCGTGDDGPDTSHHQTTQAFPSSNRRLHRLRHGVDVQPITMGTKYDRMQYEAPATAANRRPPTHGTPVVRDHTAMEHAHPVPAATPTASTPAAADGGGMGHPDAHDHAAMGHGTAQLDHAAMGDGPPPAADGATGQLSADDQAAIGHGIAERDHTAMHHPAAVDHAAMGHDMAGKDHAAMGHDMAGMAHAAMGHDMSDPGMAAAMERDMRTKFFIALLLTIPTVLYSPLGMNVLGVALPTFGLDMNLIMLVLSTPVVFYCGWMFIAGAYQSLKRRVLNMSVLIATGVLAAYVFSVLITVLGGETFFEAAAMLVTFVLFGHWMEMRSRRGTNDALRALFDLVPPQATVIRNGAEQTIPSSEVVVDDVVLLRPGDKVPVDGEVVEGETSIDEALVTGESVPVTKRPGDAVIAGSINRSGSVRFRATRVGADTTLAQIVDLVQRAQNSKAPGQRLADRAAQYLVILAVGSGVLTFVVWYIFGGATAITALTFAISAVVIACPDALGLATPTAVAVGTGIGARHNILIKDAATLENLSRVQVIVLDKTGTLTEGKPALTDVVTQGTLSEAELLRLVASAEQGSEHPLAEAIITGARQRDVPLQDASAFNSIAGHGIRATVDGHGVLAGNAKLMRDQGIDSAALDEQAATLAEGGKTPMYVAVDGTPAGLIAVADTIKPSAREAIRQFKALGITPVMITGDNRRTAAAVATALGIERFYAEVLPADKARHVKEVQAQGQQVAMVGDGVNDAPALAQADIGIAIGAGTDVAIETASVVLMKSDPLDIVRAVRLSQATVRKMQQNLVWASIYNVLAIPVAAGVFYPAFGIALRPEWSALLMSLSSIIVAVNAVLLRRVDGELGAIGTPPQSAPPAASSPRPA